MPELNKELLYEKIATISEAKGKLITEKEQLVKENEEFKKKIDELEQQVKALQAGVSMESMVKLVDELKQKLVEEINAQKEDKEDVESGTQE